MIVKLIWWLAGVFLLTGVVPASAMSSDDQIDTNRPSFTDSALVVPKGSVQFENGTLYQRFSHRAYSYDIPETEVRMGLTRSVEFQAFLPDYLLLHKAGFTNNAVTDIDEAGLKWQIGSLHQRLTCSVIGGVTIPTGKRLYSGSGVEPVIRFPYDISISKNWSVGGMQSILLLNSGRDLQYEATVVAFRMLGPKAKVFMEYGGFFTQQAFPANILHFGGVYKASRRQQLDFQFGFGLNKAAPSALVGIGYSFRFDPFR